jgi:hypothetical protein
MAKDVTVTATKAFEYRGRQVRRGSRVAMRPIDAAIEARRGHVTLIVGQHVEPDPEPEPVRSRRRYRRRDLVAED